MGSWVLELARGIWSFIEFWQIFLAYLPMFCFILKPKAQIMPTWSITNTFIREASKRIEMGYNQVAVQNFKWNSGPLFMVTNHAHFLAMKVLSLTKKKKIQLFCISRSITCSFWIIIIIQLHHLHHKTETVISFEES